MPLSGAGSSSSPSLFDAVGFVWDRAAVPAQIPTHSIDRVAFHFHRMLPEFVWDAGVLEGNPFTYSEVKTLLDGITIGGRKLSDQEQILNLAESSKRLLALVKAGRFTLTKATFIELHAIVARREALEWGVFRPELDRVFSAGLMALDEHGCPPFEKAVAFFLFGALQQFFFDGNKRTLRFMMNGVLMSAGIDALSVPAARAQEFNEAMVRFYLTKDGTEMMVFMADCHPQARQVQKMN